MLGWLLLAEWYNFSIIEMIFVAARRRFFSAIEFQVEQMAAELVVVGWVIFLFLATLFLFSVFCFCCSFDAFKHWFFWFSSKRKCNFDIFVRVDVGIDLWFPKLSQNGPKTVPRRSQEGPKGFSESFLKMYAFRKGEKCEKIILESLGGPFCRNMVPKRGPKRLPKSIKKLQKNGFLSDSLLGGLRDPKKLPKMIPN